MSEQPVELPRFERILLLEDDPGHAMLIQRVLRDFSADITHCTTVAAAVKALKEREFSLVVSDLHVPDGKESGLIEKVRSHARSAPILVLTSSTTLSVAVEAMKLGAKDYIVKNFNSEFREIFSLALDRTARAVSLERERRRLQHEMAVLRIAIENGLDGLAIINKDGSIEFSNSAFQEHVHHWGGSVISLKNLFSPEVKRAEQLKESIYEQLRSQKVAGFWSTEISLESDKNIGFRIDLAPIFGTTGLTEFGEQQWVLWLRDISDTKRREKFQREILSTTTHDLKGPLGAIILSSELISSSPEKQERVKELAVRISSSAHGAVNLIDEFLSARRLQEGTFILKPTSQPVQAVLEEVVANYETMAKAKSIELITSCSPPDLTASFDKLGLSRVLGNLLTNALKFTPKGGSVTMKARAEGSDYVLSVSDTGAGIDPQELKKLFERFSRLQKHTDVEGTGLGLFVVKCIATAHGGKISVASTPGEGTTFEILLPITPATNQNGELISLDFA